MKNRYSFRSRISEAKTREIVRCFSANLPALQAAKLTGTNRNTINRIYLGLRQRILIACEEARPVFGVVEVDESWLGPRRVKGKRGRGVYVDDAPAVLALFQEMCVIMLHAVGSFGECKSMLSQKGVDATF